MDIWSIVSACLQLATIYLVSHGGIALSLIGFDHKVVSPAMLRLRSRLKAVAIGALVICGPTFIGLMIYAEINCRPHFEGPDAQKAEQAVAECENAPDVVRPPRDAEASAWANLFKNFKYRECVERVAPQFDVQVVYVHTFRDFFNTNARAFASLFGLIFVVPGLMYFSTRLRTLDVTQDRTTLIVNACTEIYAGVILQVFLDGVNRFDIYFFKH